MGELNTFPVSYKVKGQRIVIVGGGEEALNKARLALKTTASVVIVARDVAARDLPALTVELVDRYDDGLLDNTALVFIAEAGPLADQVKIEARARGIPVNVVDVPEECDFYTPSIIDRAPLTVAVSTEGDAPVLARLVRAQIEALLAPGIGKVAALAGGLRHKVESLIQDGAARRRYYEDLVTRQMLGADEAEALLADHAMEIATY